MEAFDRSIDVHVSRIRAVIEDDPKTPRRLLTVRGSGYVFARRQDQIDGDSSRRTGRDSAAAA
jgi:DNA-binding winged helix-turn-helix (wHTH) protein